MDDEVLGRINELVDEERALEAKASPGVPLSADDEARLGAGEIGLDQCWDLLRQRRARRNAGLNPDDATVRPASTVEGYQQ